jgi:hypothetical protein
MQELVLACDDRALRNGMSRFMKIALLRQEAVVDWIPPTQGTCAVQAPWFGRQPLFNNTSLSLAASYFVEDKVAIFLRLQFPA